MTCFDLNTDSFIACCRSVKKEAFSLDEWNTWKNDVVLNVSEITWDNFRSYMYFDSGI